MPSTVFTRNRDGGLVPVDIGERSVRNVTGAKPHTAEQESHGAVAPPAQRAQLAAGHDTCDLLSREGRGQRGQTPGGNGGKRLVEMWGTAPLGHEIAHKHPHGRDVVVGLRDTMLMRSVEEKGPKALGRVPLGLLPQGLEQRQQGEARVSQRGVSRAAMGPHPTVQGHQECRGSRGGGERDRRRHVASRCEKGDPIPGAPRKLHGVGPRGFPAVMRIEVPLKRRQRLVIECREGHPSLFGPHQETMCPTQPAA